MPVVKVEIAKVKVERNSTAKCQHCKKIFDIKSLSSHIKAVEKEERIKKSAEILKKEKDAREVIAQKQKEKDLRTKLIKMEAQKKEKEANEKKMKNALRSHYISALRSDKK